MKAFTASNKPINKTIQISPQGRQALKFDVIEFEDDQHAISVNIYRGANGQVAVVYAIDRAQKAAAERTIQMSLESFGLDKDAGLMKSAYSKGGPLDSVPKPPS
jgi:hypothetical protein